MSNPKIDNAMTPSASGKGWNGGYSDSDWMGDPSQAANRQFASAGSPAYHDDVNVAWPANDITVQEYKVPSFQDRSGTPDNQDTSRPKGSV